MPKDEKRLTISNLVPGEKYAIQVRAVDKDDNSQWSQKYHIETIDDTAGGTRTPAPPALISWEVDASGQFLATWNSINTNTDGTPTVVNRYELGLTAGGGEVIVPHYGQTGALQTRVFNFGHIRSMFNGTIPTTISARLRVVNSAGTISEWSEPLIATLPVPNPPENVVATAATDAIKLTWDPPSDPIHLFGYRVYMSMTDPNFTPNITNRVYEGGAVAFTYTSLSYDLDHYFKVVSYSEPGLESTVVVPTPNPTRPISPYGPDDDPPLKITTFGFGTPPLDRTTLTAPKANLTWDIQETAPENQDISGFVVRWRVAGDTNWRNAYFEKTARAGVIDLPQPFSNYEFQISAYDFVANYSEFSDTLALTGASAPPAQVTGVSGVPRWDGLRIVWNKSSESVQYGGVYQVQLKTTNSFTNDTPDYTTANTFIDVTGLTSLTEYFYRVRAIDSANQAGPWSTVISSTLPAFPAANATDGNAPSAAPQNVTATGGLNYVNVTWDRVTNSDALSYYVYVGEDAGFTADNTTFVGETSGTSLMVTRFYDDTPLVQDTPYYFKVRAVDADGEGPISASANSMLTQVLSTDLGIDMGGENLLYNSSFDVDSDNNGTANYWQVVNTTSATEPHTASLVTGRNGVGKAQRISWTGVNTGTKGIKSLNAPVLRPNTEYMISFYARGNGGSGFGVTSTPAFSSVAWVENPEVTSSFGARYIVRVVTGATVDAANATVYIVGNTVNGGWFEIDDMQIEAGNTASAYKTGTVSIAKLATGRFNTADMIISTGGRIVSETYLSNPNTGFLITDSGIVLKDGQVDAKTLVANTTITSNLYVGALLEIANGGAIRSQNYSNGAGGTTPAGFRIDSVGIDIRSGTVAAGTFGAGTITSPDIKVGANGKITIDSTGAIQSNNYAVNATGWKISSNGIEMNDANSKINVNALVSSTLTTTTLTIGSGGVIRSKDWAANGAVRWQLSETGFTMIGGTITGSTITTDQLYSQQSETMGGVTRRKFSINAEGYAEFSGVRIYGNALVGNHPDNVIQSGNYNGSQGWRIQGDGTANFFNMNTWNARVYGAAVVGGVDGQYSYMKSYNWASQSAGWLIQSDGYAEFNGGSFRIGSGGGGLTWILDGGGGNAQIRFYVPGDTSRYNMVRANGVMFEMRGAYGGAVEMYPASSWWTGATLVRLIQDVDVTQRLFVGNNITVYQGGIWIQNGGLGITNGGIDANGQIKFGNLGGTDGQRYVHVGNAGVLQRGNATSIRAAKKNIEPLGVSAEAILDLEPKEYHFKTQDDSEKKRMGFIAEDAEELGLDLWIDYDEEGKLNGFDYPYFVVALQQVARHQRDEIAGLKDEVAELKTLLKQALDK